jgi:hypothetical protein
VHAISVEIIRECVQLSLQVDRAPEEHVIAISRRTVPLSRSTNECAIGAQETDFA